MLLPALQSEGTKTISHGINCPGKVSQWYENRMIPFYGFHFGTNRKCASIPKHDHHSCKYFLHIWTEQAAAVGPMHQIYKTKIGKELSAHLRVKVPLKGANAFA